MTRCFGRLHAAGGAGRPHASRGPPRRHGPWSQVAHVPIPPGQWGIPTPSLNHDSAKIWGVWYTTPYPHRPEIGLQTSPKGKSPASLPGATPTWHGESVYLLKLATGVCCASAGRHGSLCKTHTLSYQLVRAHIHLLCSQDIFSMIFGHTPASKKLFRTSSENGQ